MTPNERAQKVAIELNRVYPDRSPLLKYTTPFELAISVILSAQTTDAQVNQVTPELFAAYPGPDELAGAPQEVVERIVHSTGFFRSKARNVIAAARVIRDEFGGALPSTIDELVKIPGMGRKSANVITGVIHGEPSIVVDTHLTRVSNRIGLVNGNNPVKLERELREIVPLELQTDFSMGVNLHGRYRCFARKPDCPACEIRSICLWNGKASQAEPATR